MRRVYDDKAAGSRSIASKWTFQRAGTCFACGEARASDLDLEAAEIVVVVVEAPGGLEKECWDRRRVAERKFKRGGEQLLGQHETGCCMRRRGELSLVLPAHEGGVQVCAAATRRVIRSVMKRAVECA